jgi:hypothetical protein
LGATMAIATKVPRAGGFLFTIGVLTRHYYNPVC